MNYRGFSLLVVVLAILISACATRQSSPPPATETPTPAATPTSVGTTNTEPAGVPICFTPRELLPFAFSPDASRLMIRTNQGVQVIDLQAGKEQAFILAPQMVYTAALSPDGETLAWSLAVNSIQLVHVSDQQVLHSLVGHPDLVLDLRFSPDGAELYSASHDGVVRVWDTSNGTQKSAIQAGREILGIGVTPDGSRLATIPGDGPVQLWDLADNGVIAEFGGTGGYDTSDAVFSPDGQYLAADLATGIYLWRVEGAELVRDSFANSMAIAYSPDGEFFAYADVNENNNVILTSPDGGQVIRTIEGMQGPVWELFFSPDGALLAATDGIEIRVWWVSDGNLLYIGKPICE